MNEPLATIHVDQNGAGPTVVVDVRGADREPLPVRPDELKDIAKSVGPILTEFKEMVGGETKPTDARLTDAVRFLYRKTDSWASALAHDEGDRLVRIGQSLRRAWQRWDDPGQEVQVIEVLGHDFGFPFELLPLFDMESDLPSAIQRPDQLASEMRRFVGYGALVRRESAATHHADTIGTTPLRVRFLRFVMPGADSEYAFLSGIKNMDVEGPWPPEGVTQSNVVKKLVDALINPRLVLGEKEEPEEHDPPAHIVHFACHCHTDKPFDSDWEIELGRPVAPLKVTLFDLRHGFKKSATSASPRPLVFMNACGTSVIDPTTSASFQRWFMANGHLGFIGTQTAVPDKVAAVFAGGLYEKLLAGHPLGQAIVLARRRLVENCSNPLGILWTVQADPQLQLTTPSPLATDRDQ